MTDNQKIMLEEYERLKSSRNYVLYESLIDNLKSKYGWNGMRIGAVTSGLRNAGFLNLNKDIVTIDMSEERREAVLLARKEQGGTKHAHDVQDARTGKGEATEIGVDIGIPGGDTTVIVVYEERIVNRPWGSSKQLRGCLDCKFYADDEKNRKSQCYGCKRDITGFFTEWVWKHESHITEIIQNPEYKEYPQYDKVRLRIPKGEKL